MVAKNEIPNSPLSCMDVFSRFDGQDRFDFAEDTVYAGEETRHVPAIISHERPALSNVALYIGRIGRENKGFTKNILSQRFTCLRLLGGASDHPPGLLGQ